MITVSKKFGRTTITDAKGNSKTYALGISLPREAVLNACDSIKEAEIVETYVKKLENLEKGSSIGSVQKLLQDAGLSLPLIKTILEVANLSKSGISSKELYESVLKSTKVEDFGALAASEFSEQFSERAAETALKSKEKVAEQNSEFTRDIQAFFKEFKEKYLSAYLDDIKTMDKDAAVAFLRPKLEALSSSVVEQFENSYRLKFIGKKPYEQDMISEEKYARSQIVIDALTVMFGEVVLEKNASLLEEASSMDSSSGKAVMEATNFLKKAKRAKENIDRTIAKNTAASGYVTGRVESTLTGGVELEGGKKSPTAEELSETTHVHEDSTKRSELSNAYNEAAKNLEELMSKLKTAVKSDSKLKVDQSDFEAASVLLGKTTTKINKMLINKKYEDVEIIISDINKLIETISTKNQTVLDTLASIEAAAQPGAGA